MLGPMSCHQGWNVSLRLCSVFLSSGKRELGTTPVGSWIIQDLGKELLSQTGRKRVPPYVCLYHQWWPPTRHRCLAPGEVLKALPPPTGAVCIPSCIIPPSDPVILPRNVTAETMDHRLQPTRVQVKGEVNSSSRGVAGSTEKEPPFLSVRCLNPKSLPQVEKGKTWKDKQWVLLCILLLSYTKVQHSYQLPSQLSRNCRIPQYVKLNARIPLIFQDVLCA